MRILGLAVLLAACTLPAGGETYLPLTARGQEPGWLLKAGPEGMSLLRQSGETLTAPLPDPRRRRGAVRYVTPSIAFEIRPGLCHDIMSGMPYPLSVTLLEEPPLQGCGGEPSALLQGNWIVERVAGAPAPFGVTFSIEGDRITGNGGCNRFLGSYATTGEGLDIGPLAGTRMACPGRGFESRFLSALERVSRFDIAEGGTLLLFEGDSPVVVARR
ncbi:META domain-containing protein [Rhodobacter sp. NSM]|uniref:META domain-containing protein n=1 Tax=Rhodobacter sp. NSM TaxID=3457501 RepID=UPI003FD45FE9